MRVVLHIGATKTGSSALQATLHDRRDELARHGILYSAIGVAAGAHHLLAAAIHPGAWRMHQHELPEDRAAYFEDGAASIRGEAMTACAETIILSSEYFWGAFPPDFYRKVKAAFPEASFELVAFVRQPDDWVISSYAQAVKSGESRDFSTWSTDIMDRWGSGFHVFRVINRWRTYLDAQQTHVLRYASVKGNVYAAFCERLGIDVDPHLPMKVVNPSPSAEGLAKLLEINRSEMADEEKAAARRKVMVAHRADPSAGAGPPIASDEEREEILRRARPSERLLERVFSVTG
ncbi:MAG: hypothetical protein AAGF49_03775 [Pseudomonadota bacterium]